MGPALKLSCLSKVFAKASNVKRVALRLGLAYCGIYTFTSQVAQIFLISGPSMVPTLSEGDWVLAIPTRSVFWYFVPLSVCQALLGREDFSSIDKGDVVIAKDPTEPTSTIVKRVALLEKEYIHSHRARVPAGHAWLLSDDLALGRDSRHYGPVPLGLVHGRVLCGSLENQ